MVGTMTPFKPGDYGSFNGIEWRISEGQKPVRREGAIDMRLDIRTPGGEWRAVPMHLGFLMADLFFQVEEALYPQPRWDGGNKYIRAVHRAVQHGFEAAARELDEERRRR
jgi:hypothetical protein